MMATPYVKERGCVDCRYVVVKWFTVDGRVKEYSCHDQSIDGNLFSGVYCGTKKQGADIARGKMAENPRAYAGKYLRDVDCKPGER